MATWAEVQRHLGIAADGVPGQQTLAAIVKALGIGKPPAAANDAAFSPATFIARHSNLNAGKLGPEHIDAAAKRLQVTPAHIRAIKAVESRGAGFDKKGRPALLFEPHIFHRRTAGKFGPSPFSYARWREQPYPPTFDERWQQIADAAAHDEAAALESASWGMFQIMGFHWQALNYRSAQDFAAAMVKGEPEHLDALIRFIEANGLAPALRRCKPGDPASCRDFARGYNGSGFEANGYHTKLAGAIK